MYSKCKLNKARKEVYRQEPLNYRTDSRKAKVQKALRLMRNANKNIFRDVQNKMKLNWCSSCSRKTFKCYQRTVKNIDLYFWFRIFQQRTMHYEKQNERQD